MNERKKSNPFLKRLVDKIVFKLIGLSSAPYYDRADFAAKFTTSIIVKYQFYDYRNSCINGSSCIILSAARHPHELSLKHVAKYDVVGYPCVASGRFRNFYFQVLLDQVVTKYGWYR